MYIYIYIAGAAPGAPPLTIMSHQRVRQRGPTKKLGPNCAACDAAFKVEDCIFFGNISLTKHYLASVISLVSFGHIIWI